MDFRELALRGSTAMMVSSPTRPAGNPDGDG
jgi:hypothetical protein